MGSRMTLKKEVHDEKNLTDSERLTFDLLSDILADMDKIKAKLGIV